MTSGTTNSLYSVWGTSGSDPRAFGSNGQISRGIRGGTAGTRGNYTDFGFSSNFSPDYLLGQPTITLTSGFVMTDFGLITTAAGSQVQMALYSDDLGSPGELVANTGATSIASAARYEISVDPVYLAPGTYWIMAIYDVDTQVAKENVGTVTTDYINHTFGNALPSTFPTSSTYETGGINYYIRGAGN